MLTNKYDKLLETLINWYDVKKIAALIYKQFL